MSSVNRLAGPTTRSRTYRSVGRRGHRSACRPPTRCKWCAARWGRFGTLRSRRRRWRSGTASARCRPCSDTTCPGRRRPGAARVLLTGAGVGADVAVSVGLAERTLLQLRPHPGHRVTGGAAQARAVLVVLEQGQVVPRGWRANTDAIIGARRLGAGIDALVRQRAAGGVLLAVATGLWLRSASPAARGCCTRRRSCTRCNGGTGAL